MYCKNCGKQIDNDSNFCSYCGTKQTIQMVDIDTQVDAKTVNVNLTFGRQNSPKQKSEAIAVEKYDTSYQRESDATVVGVTLMTVNFGVLLFGGIKDEAVYSTVLIFGFLLRIILTIYCTNIAKRQNRDTFGWGFFALILPSLALIIIGLLRKLKNNNLADQDNIGLDSQNQEPKISRILLRETTDGKTLQIHSSISAGYTVGDIVTIDDKPAPDGKYKMGFMDSLLIQNGRLKSL